MIAASNQLLFVGRYNNEVFYAMPTTATAGTTAHSDPHLPLDSDSGIQLEVPNAPWQSDDQNALATLNWETPACQPSFDETSALATLEGGKTDGTTPMTPADSTDDSEVSVVEDRDGQRAEEDCIADHGSTSFYHVVGYHVMPLQTETRSALSDSNRSQRRQIGETVILPPPRRIEPPAILRAATELRLIDIFIAAVVACIPIACVIGGGFYFLFRFRRTAAMEALSSSRTSNPGSGGSGSGRQRSSASVGDGGVEGDSIEIGRIVYRPQQLLGRGCHGTCVFRGHFDDRPVAVKRILPDCYSLADREVDLLRRADQHPNVIRYYCKEADSQFIYIALELCSATLSDCVMGRADVGAVSLDVRWLLQQVMSGLRHLHTLQIVHRDIKPHNVLLAFSSTSHAKAEITTAGTTSLTPTMAPPPPPNVRVLISDFGLCKQVLDGRASLTRHTGTQYDIANIMHWHIFLIKLRLGSLHRVYQERRNTPRVYLSVDFERRQSKQ